MSNIWTLIKNNFKIQVIKKPVSFTVFLLAPVIIMFIAMKILFGSTGFLTVGVIDNDKSQLSSYIIEEMQLIGSINLRVIDENHIKTGFAENTLNGVIRINEGFQQGVISEDIKKIDVITKEGEGDVEGLITYVLKRKVDTLAKISKAAQGYENSFWKILSEVKERKSISLQKRSLLDLQDDFTTTQIVLGFLNFLYAS